MGQTLSDCVDEYLGRVLTMRSPATARATGYKLRAYIAFTGNIQIRNNEARHVDAFFAHLAGKGLTQGTMNNYITILTVFFRWARSQKYLALNNDPMVGRRSRKAAPTKKLRIAIEDLPLVLDSASHPRDRIAIAVGYFTLLRSSEIANLRVVDLDQHSWTIDAEIIKTHLRDEFVPINADLQDEMQRWLRWYKKSQNVTTLDPEWYLIPAKSAPQCYWDTTYGKLMPTSTGGPAPLRPTDRMGPMHKYVQAAIETAGVLPVRSQGGEPNRLGAHTLRRSGARALYDDLVAAGYSDALRIVQAMLHHSNQAMTEIYIGIDQERERRNDFVQGRRMLKTSSNAKVIPLRK